VHTGYLTFPRRIEPGQDTRLQELLEEQGWVVEKG
jgi:hypothetical protein